MSRPSTTNARTVALLGAGVLSVGAAAGLAALWYRNKQQQKKTAAAKSTPSTDDTNSNDADTATSATTATSSSSSSSQRTIVIGTRSSKLAMWQAEHVRDRLQEAYPDIIFKVEGINTLGDVDQIKPLSDFGSKGVFTKELDVATLNHSIDIAVHCLKDLPTTLPDGLVTGAILERGDTEDALVLPLSHPKHQKGSLEDVKEGGVIGTSAMRRSAFIARHYPQLKTQNIRGNVLTRLDKLDRGDYDGLILARVGLQRLGLSRRISQVLDSKKYGYAVGQGALAILCREGDAATINLLSVLDDLPTRWSCEAERGVLRTLNGGCKVPIAIRTTMDNPSKKYLEENPSAAAHPELVRTLHVWCSVMSLDGKEEIHAAHTSTVDASGADQQSREESLLAAKRMGEELGQMLLQKGADKLLEGIVDTDERLSFSAPTKTKATQEAAEVLAADKQ